jgi:uncharacterized repeat protein (TIGR03847 family)
MDLEEPVIPEWRAGRLSVGYDEERDLILLEAEELTPGDEDDEEDEPDEDELDDADAPGNVRFWATREQALALARYGSTVAAAGRPLCPLCGNPMDPEGHICPALNGHSGTELA